MMLQSLIIFFFVLAATLVTADKDGFQTFSSSSQFIREIHPLQHFAIHHEELSSVSINEIPTGHHHRLSNGHHQPYPEQLSFEIELFNQRLNYDLELQTSIIEPNLMSEVVYDDGRVEYERFSLTTYLAEHEHGYTVVTLRNDQTFLATIMHEGETYEVEPVHLHRRSTSSHEEFELLQAHTPLNMVYFRRSDMTQTPESHACGTTDEHHHAHDGHNDDHDAHLTNEQPLNYHRQQQQSLSTMSTKSIINSSNLFFKNSTNVRRLMVTDNDLFFPGCFTNDATSARVMSIGIATDYGFYLLAGSTTSGVQSLAAQTLALVNTVYYPQLRIFLRMTHNKIMATSTTIGTSWNFRPDTTTGRCTNTIETQLSRFRSWRSTSAFRQASIWHLLTDCYPPPGTVGIAYVGTLCDSYGVGVTTYYNGGFWTAMAHEIGHNFNAAHTFDYGVPVGRIGGIMDYCDGALPCGSGNYAFDKTYSRSTMCPEISANLADTTTTPYCFASFAPVCGNGVVEPGETCDDNSSCCVNCQLAAVAQCSGGECCTSDCKYKYTTSLCGKIDGIFTGYCSAGTCQPSRCYKYSNLQSGCGMSSTNACRELCNYQSSCTDGFTDTTFQNLPDGSTCAANSICTNGICTATDVYNWVYDPFPSCTASCGQSQTLIRTFKCVSASTGQTVANTYCGSHTQPITTVCTGACSYAWSTPVPVGSCSVTCGAGSQSLSTYCYETGAPNIAVSDSLCNPNTKPATSRSCNTQACPVQYIITSDWSECSKTCGGGSQTRTIQCQYQQNNVWLNSDSSFCSGLTAPATSQSCNTDACSPYNWEASSWGQCSVLCGGGIRNRVVICRALNGTSVDDSYCDATIKLTTSDLCNLQDCVVNYGWTSSQWSNCSLTCGSGTRTRQVTCMNLDINTIVQDSYCTDAKPATIESCNTQLCPNYQWRTSSWSRCQITVTANCSGVQTREVRCYNLNHCNNHKRCEAEEVSNSLCDPNTKPASSQSCTSTCGTKRGSFYWYTSNYNPCSSNCGLGSQSRTVECRSLTTNLIATDVDCRPFGPKPLSNSLCFEKACPSYDVGPWSACSARCGTGEQSRLVKCVDGSGQAIDESQCINLIKPSITQVCQAQLPCPRWVPSDWSSCNKLCGGGVQTRELLCRLPHDEVFQGQIMEDTSLCPSIPSDMDPFIGSFDVPATSQTCNIDACASYYWIVNWNQCSMPCGGGIQQGTVKCFDSSSQTVVDNSYCIDDPPATERACNIDPCPIYNWKAISNWTTCNVVCGQGSQTRQVACVNENPSNPISNTLSYEVVPSSYCASLPLSSKPTTTQSCSMSTDICNGGSIISPNGNCVSGSCQCRSGYFGLDCSQRSFISNVQTDATSYPSGITSVDRLLITWDSSADIDVVSLLLFRNGWNIPIYIANEIPNTGFYLWSFDPNDPAIFTIQENSNYFVNVWYSDTISASSASFSVADTCAYKFCGMNGQCTKGQCSCKRGFIGVLCSNATCSSSTCSGTGTCNNAGTCRCSSGYSGPNCNTPTLCRNKCLNGGDLPKLAVLSSCTTTNCICKNYWTGSTCRTCSLNCGDNGRASSDCNNCNCNAGFYGPSCTCVYYTIQLTLTFATPARNIINNADEFERLKSAIISDVALTAGISKRLVVVEKVVAVTSSSTSALATIRLLGECNAALRYDVIQRPSLSSEQIASQLQSSLNTISYESENGQVHMADVSDVSDITYRSLSSVMDSYALFHSEISNLESSFYHSYISSSMDINSPIIVSDYSGLSTPSSPTEICDPISNHCINPNNNHNNDISSSTMIISIVVAGVMFIIVSTAIYYGYKRYKQNQINRNNNSNDNDKQSKSDVYL